MICEKCGVEHDGEYGSGRFCSRKCARSYSTAARRNEISLAVSRKLSGTKCGNGTFSEVNRHVFVKEDWIKSHAVRNKKLRMESDAADDLSAYGKTTKYKTLHRQQGGRCAICRMKEKWNGKTLKFEIDHIDGNRKNESRKNLRLLCPNCHSQTETFCGKNKKKNN